MTQDRNAIIRALGKYFHIKELVCPHCYAKWGTKAWQFLDTDLLYCLLLLRETIICKPMVVNYNGHWQRGLRCNMCDLVKSKTSVYLSAHVLGKAIDFNVQGMSSEEARRLIKLHAPSSPCNVRLEKNVSWVHFDVLQAWGVTDKVYEFTA